MDMSNPTETGQTSSVARYAQDAALGLIITVAIGAVIASLAAAGVITMTVAIGFLVLAFIVIMAGTIFLDHLWRLSWKSRTAIAIAALAVLGGIGAYEWRNFSPLLTKEDIASLIPKSPPSAPIPTAPATPAVANKRPLFEATDHSRIDATGATLPQIGIPWARADGYSSVDMSSISILSDQNVQVINIPAERVRRFSSKGTYKNLSHRELKEKATDTAKKLRALHKAFLIDFFGPDGKYPDDNKEHDVSQKYDEIYKALYADMAVELSSTMLTITGPVKLTSLPNDAQRGSAKIFGKTLVGAEPLLAAAEFLEVMADRLPKN